MENREIERKWLIEKIPFDLKGYECLEIEQAYLSPSPTVRVRKENEEYYLTYKGSRKMEGNSDLSHSEYNLPLDRESYYHLREKKDGILIAKKRYRIPYEKGLVIELDVFEEPYEGLIIAEVEFDTEDEAVFFTPPEWFGKDVTGVPKYKNACMACGISF
ncbi:MAG: CYTH domain-containing protein [Lachnospiraceae bacterium]|nr:CYTH domain-containing protein [Lachnospiraceae bacterium]